MSSSEEPTEPTQFVVELQTDANASNDNAMPTLRPYDQTPITPGEKKNTAKKTLHRTKSLKRMWDDYNWYLEENWSHDS